MITKFTSYIVESRKSIDDLEMLNTFELGKLLLDEVYKDSPDVQFIQDLLDVGCPIDYMDNWDRTALHFASRDEHLEIAKLLISRGSDVNARTKDGLKTHGRTPLHFAVMAGNSELTKFLLSRGANINLRDSANLRAWDIARPAIREFAPELNPNK